jgi:hypothetical protein
MGKLGNAKGKKEGGRKTLRGEEGKARKESEQIGECKISRNRFKFGVDVWLTDLNIGFEFQVIYIIFTLALIFRGS